MTNINEPAIWCPIPTAAHPEPWTGKRAEMCRLRSLVSVLLFRDEVRAKQRSVVFDGLRWQNWVAEADAAETPERGATTRRVERIRSQELRIVFILPIKRTKDHEMYEGLGEGDEMRLMSEFFEYWWHNATFPIGTWLAQADRRPFYAD
jgi:hypothetical protein